MATSPDSDRAIPADHVPGNQYPVGLVTLPPDVKAAELGYVADRRNAATTKKYYDQAQRDTENVAGNLVGVALSGGGIRSATFASGVVQKLAKCGVLPVADYLCTVSGGGYLGACLSSLTTFLELGQANVPDAASSNVTPADREAAEETADGADDQSDVTSAQTDEEETAEVREPDAKPYSPTGDDDVWWKRAKAGQHLPGNADSGVVQPADAEAPRFDTGENSPLLLREQVHHLRKHGDFVMVRQGVFRRETLRSIGWFVTGLLCTVTLYVLCLAICAAVFTGYATVLAGRGVWQSDAMGGFWETLVGSCRAESGALLAALLTGAAVTILGWVALIYTRAPTAEGSPHETTPERTERKRLACVGSFLVSMAFATSLALRLWWGSQVALHLFGLITPLAFSFGVLLGAGALNVLWLPRAHRWNRGYRSLSGAAYGIGVVLVVCSLLFIAAVGATHWIISGDLARVLSSLSLDAAILVVGRWLLKLSTASDGRSASSQKIRRLVIDKAQVVIVVAFILLTLVLASAGIVAMARGSGLTVGVMAFVCGGASLVLFVLLGFAIDFNRIGPHYFYRDRLIETYLQTEACLDSGGPVQGGTGGYTQMELVRNDALLKLKDLHHWQAGSSNPAPYHLIECAVNLAGSRDLARRDRKSDHFIFSRDYCGSTTTGYVPTGEYRGGTTKLCAAMTISGAAAGSAMGYHTSLAQSFVATLFNVRLGSWFVNPRVYHEDDNGNNQVIYPPFWSPRCWRAAGGLQMWIERVCGLRSRSRMERGIFWPWYLLREMFAKTDAQGALVNLSDGGHTGDNIALYPLLQRRCKLIFAVDGEADPEYNFGSLASAIRQIYSDENIGIDIDLENLRPVPGTDDGRVGQHYAIGKITYPQGALPGGDLHALHDRLSNVDRDGGEAWIIYLKSSLRKACAPATVASYAAYNQQFPHQSTLDQFFSDDQFEAYRSLGGHVAESMLRNFFEWWKKADQNRAPGGGGPAAQASGSSNAPPAEHFERTLEGLIAQNPEILVSRLEAWAKETYEGREPGSTLPPPNDDDEPEEESTPPTKRQILAVLKKRQKKKDAHKELGLEESQFNALYRKHGVKQDDWRRKQR